MLGGLRPLCWSLGHGVARSREANPPTLDEWGRHSCAGLVTRLVGLLQDEGSQLTEG